MNQTPEPSDREKWEERIVAMLLGEVDPGEQAEVEAALHRDPELRRFHHEMERTIGLIQSVHRADIQEGTPEVPMQLSESRRRALLEHLRNPVPRPTSKVIAWAGHLLRLPYAVPTAIAACLALVVTIFSFRQGYEGNMDAKITSSISQEGGEVQLGATLYESDSLAVAPRSTEELSETDPPPAAPRRRGAAISDEKPTPSKPESPPASRPSDNPTLSFGLPAQRGIARAEPASGGIQAGAEVSDYAVAQSKRRPAAVEDAEERISELGRRLATRKAESEMAKSETPAKAPVVRAEPEVDRTVGVKGIADNLRRLAKPFQPEGAPSAAPTDQPETRYGGYGVHPIQGREPNGDLRREGVAKLDLLRGNGREVPQIQRTARSMAESYSAPTPEPANRRLDEKELRLEQLKTMNLVAKEPAVQEQLARRGEERRGRQSEERFAEALSIKLGQKAAVGGGLQRQQSLSSSTSPADNFLKLGHDSTGLGDSVGNRPSVSAGRVIVGERLALLTNQTQEFYFQGQSAPTAGGRGGAVFDELDAPRVVAPRSPAQPLPEMETAENPLSTFSLNVSGVSFELAAANLEQGIMPEPGDLRSEEFVNAMRYGDPLPPPGQRIGLTWERAHSPFGFERDFLRLAVQTAATGRESGRSFNLVLLIDNSGSMERSDRVSIMEEALAVLTGYLRLADRVSVVVFARTPQLLIDGMIMENSEEFLRKVTGRNPSGGTNLEAALDLAYETARRHFLPDGINRVILMTDGAANLGDVEPERLREKVVENRRKGIALDCFGIGWEGYNDYLLERLSHNGDGRYGFLNRPEQAATEFADQIAGALQVAAADVKAQVEFNPNRITTWRQVGYERHQLTAEQFRDNTVDAAEIGAAESGNALYVIQVDDTGNGPLGTVRVRYRIPGTDNYQETAWEVPYTGRAIALKQASPAMRLAVVAGTFGEWLAQNPYAAEVSPGALLDLLAGVPEHYSPDPQPTRLREMIRTARRLTSP